MNKSGEMTGILPYGVYNDIHEDHDKHRQQGSHL
jgi:hypothetical protein